MGQLQRFNDFTGDMTKISQFDREITEIMEEINRTQVDYQNFNQTLIMPGDNGSPQIIIGNLRNGRFGQLFHDSNGTPRILIGQAPDDGRMGIWVSKPGEDVLKLLGG